MKRPVLPMLRVAVILAALLCLILWFYHVFPLARLLERDGFSPETALSLAVEEGGGPYLRSQYQLTGREARTAVDWLADLPLRRSLVQPQYYSGGGEGEHLYYTARLERVGARAELRIAPAGSLLYLEWQGRAYRLLLSPEELGGFYTLLEGFDREGA